MDPAKVALITGGAKRVGRAIVERLAASGFDVAFTYLNSAKDADDVVAAVNRSGGRDALSIRADLTEPQVAAPLIVDSVTRRFGRLDVLVNSASVYVPDPPAAVDAEQVRKLFAIHYESPLRLCQGFAAALRASRGHIVNILDVTVERPWPEYTTYCASKAALWNLTLSLARAMAPDVTVNGIAPSVVEWPVDAPQEYRARYLNRILLGRPGTVQDVANAIHYLCTEGSYVTGQILRLDGGYSVS